MSRARLLAVWVVATVLVAALIGWLAAAAVPARTDFLAWLVAGCSVVGIAACGWLWVLVGLVVVDELRGRPERPGVAGAVRRGVLALCGLAIAGGLAAPAQGAGHGRGVPAPGPESAATVLAGLPTPDRATSTSAWLRAVAARSDVPGRADEAPADSAGHVVVAPGDTLWDLARDSLPGEPDAADVVRRWREIYAANRDVVGSDPDLIRPGMRLVLPHRAARPIDRHT